MLYGAYCRVSTEEQAKNETIDAQIDVINAYCKQNKITIPKERWYIDDGHSGELMLRERPDGARLLLDAMEEKITHLIVAKVNRLAREDYAAQEAYHSLKKCGVLLISLTEPFNYFEPSGQMMATVFSSFAAYDRASIKQNFAEGKARKARRGKLPQGGIPFGYKVAEDKTVEINPEQAEVIKLIYKLYINDNMSIRAITEYLTSINTPAPADYKKSWYKNSTGGWCEYSVNQILKSDIYTGIYPYKPPGQNPIEVPIPEIIDSNTYFKARTIAKNKRQNYAPNEHYRKYLLSGLIQCGICKSAYVGTSSGKGRFAYYRCTRKKQPPDDIPCKNLNINADLIEELAWEDLCKTFRSPGKLIKEVSRELENNIAHRNDYAAEIDEIDKRMDEITLEKKRLLDLFAKGLTDEKDLLRAVNERELSLDTLLGRKKFLVQQIELHQTQTDDINNLTDIAETIQDLLNGDDEEVKKYVFETLIDQIEIYPGESKKPEIRISYRINLDSLSDCYLVK